MENIQHYASDIEIYSALFALVAPPTTPPRLTSPTLVQDTPVKSNSASQQGSEQLHGDIDRRIIQEIDGCMYTDTKGFEKYFENKSWSEDVEQIIQDANPQVVNGCWTDYPTVPTEPAVLEFVLSTFCRGRGTFRASPRLPLGGSDCKRRPDVFLILSGTVENNGRYSWADVRVIGELKRSEIAKKKRDEVIEFCGHAREVFASQPTRRFLHGFFIRGSMMQLWVFDRSGPYASEKFDIHGDPRRFIKIMTGYTMMSDEELGMNVFIKEDKIGKYILFKGDDEVDEENLYLEDQPIAFQRAIICRGTTCYRAKRQHSKNWEFVAKFSWRSDKRSAEGTLLKLAKERNVWGVAQLFGHQDLESIAGLREGLQFGNPQTFRMAKKNAIDQSLSKTMNSIHLKALEFSPINTLVGQKRERADKAVPTGRAKRSKPLPSRRQSDITNLVTAEGDDGSEEVDQHQIDPVDTNSLMAPEIRNNEPFDNRILSCLVISPPGRAIDKFESIEEFLEACRDFVRAHWSLYNDGKLLHRDISKNNVIITNAGNSGDPKGMLIDLDLAKELDDGPSGARHRTGTMEFMAIGVLEGCSHTYRHDLESFFYVFLWVIIGYNHGADHSLPEESQLRGWYTGSYQDIADKKRAHMSEERFPSILAEFPQEFESLKGLAEELRGIVFTHRNGFSTKTPSDPEQLYRPMIEVYGKAIASCKDMGSGKTEPQGASVLKPESAPRKRRPPTCSTCGVAGHTKVQCQERIR